MPSMGVDKPDERQRGRERRPRGAAIREMLSRNGALGGLVVMVIVLTILSADFLTVENVLNIGTQAAVIAILAYGQTFVIVAGCIDLSVGSVLGLTGVILGWLIASPVQRAVKSRLWESDRNEDIPAPYVAQLVLRNSACGTC